MFDNLRKGNVSPAGSTHSPSPYARVQEALSNAPSGAQSAAPSGVKAPTPEPPKAESTRIDAAHIAAAPEKAEAPVSKLIVGPDIKLKGVEITDCNTLVVEGRVEAAMESRVLQIAEIGAFVGKAGVDMAEIRGRFDGELTVRKQLVIRATGHVSGKIRYGKLSIEEGGELSGDIDVIGPAPTLPANRPGLAAKVSIPPN